MNKTTTNIQMDGNTTVQDPSTVSSPGPSEDPSPEAPSSIHVSATSAIIGTIQIAVVLVTILGNIMVLVAVYKEKRLRTTFNYYLVNLAITDLAVAVTAMSFYTTSNILGYWPFGEFMCGVWIFFDYGMTFVSVFTLILISIDRYWSVTWYIHYREHHNNRTCLLSIASAWVFMLLLWLPPCIKDRMQNSIPGECKWEPSLNPIFVIIVAVLGHHGSCFILLFCYIRVFLYMRNKRKVGLLGTTKRVPVTSPSFNPTSVVTTISRLQQPMPGPSKHIENENGASSSELYHNGNQANKSKEHNDVRMKRRRQDSKVFVTLSYIMIGYMICWVPFHVVFDISCIDVTLVPESVFTVTFWMTYLNSTINPILYNFSSIEFRNAFRKMLSRRPRLTTR